MLLALRSLWEGTGAGPAPFIASGFTCDAPCIVCPDGSDPNNPFLNFSAETPDVDKFIGRGYTLNNPPLGLFFYAVGCVGWCVADTQEEADLCAAQQNILCTGGNWPGVVVLPPGGNPNTPIIQTPRTIYRSTAQTATATCADGSTSTYTTPAGTFWAFNQATANAQALSYAKNKANLNTICISTLSTSRICYLTAATVTLTATNVLVTSDFAVVAGDLPDGMTLQNTGLGTASITGTPTVSGLFSFSIGVLDFFGSYAETNLTLDVFGIINSSPLPSGTNGVAYLQTMVLGGTPIGNWDFTITSGALPTGLTLNTVTGIISGTPTVDGVYAFTIQVQDEL